MIVGSCFVSRYPSAVWIQVVSGRARPVTRPAVTNDQLSQIVAPLNGIPSARAVDNPIHHVSRVMLRLPFVAGNRKKRIGEPPQSFSQRFVFSATDFSKSFALRVVEKRRHVSPAATLSIRHRLQRFPECRIGSSVVPELVQGESGKCIAPPARCFA